MNRRTRAKAATVVAPTTGPRTRPPKPDPDRDARALDNAARRVPPWQVAVVAILGAVADDPDVAGKPRFQARARQAITQTPAAVRRAAELHRAGKWRAL